MAFLGMTGKNGTYIKEQEKKFAACTLAIVNYHPIPDRNPGINAPKRGWHKQNKHVITKVSFSFLRKKFITCISQ